MNAGRNVAQRLIAAHLVGGEMRLAHDLSGRQVEMVLAGGRIPLSAGPGTYENEA